MMELAELKRLYELYRHSQDPLDLAALKFALLNSWPELIAHIERVDAALLEIEAIEFGRGLEVAKQIARNAREPEK